MAAEKKNKKKNRNKKLYSYFWVILETSELWAQKNLQTAVLKLTVHDSAIAQFALKLVKAREEDFYYLFFFCRYL